MTQLQSHVALVTFIALLITAAGFALPAHADHSEEAQEESHAATVKAHEVEVHATGPVTTTVTYAPTINVAKVATMQELLKALQQLVLLLQEKKELIEHDATPHEHDEDDAHHDESEDEDDKNNSHN